MASNPNPNSSARSMANTQQQLHPISSQQLPISHHNRPPHFHPYQHTNTIKQQPGVFPIQTQVGKVSDPIRYPLASSGRGLLPTQKGFPPQLPHQGANFGSCPPMHTSLAANSAFLHPSLSHTHMSLASISAAATATATGVPFNNNTSSKVGSSPCATPDLNAPKDLKDKNADDKLITIRDRKVRISDGVSLYALCRSWLRNGYLEEIQPQYGDGFRSLPKPLPLSLPDSFSPKRKESDEDTEDDEKIVENLSAKELLKMHVKRAKRVRARLREERLQRIQRYKGRLALLLPSNGAVQE
ncbi:uncharacterized protein LOC130803623 isoform X1 [Amaranthus tricolor]|uniref:uncharacterized protein LOC130803623 isoform X1 n=1 Tax=Amaranthus tricolor TaxID=29722 RepID=UPI00258DAC04|nr:uncharacterized protein LOC130803623 isoform X1 [Amaranthus tricolor]XP_057523795.1 uncharacterized protein LOC130803623 isoform X1 [Amaranthus tricolor]